MKMRYAEIGAPRTGSRSLAKAFEQLGISSCHGIWAVDTAEILHAMLSGECLLPPYKEFEFVGNLANVHWLDLAETYPDLKFILTVRDENEWIDRLWTKWRRVRRWKSNLWCKEGLSGQDIISLISVWSLFRSFRINKEVLIRYYRKHNADIKAYFSDDRLLVMNICAGDGWGVLCPWLGVEIPKAPFPQTTKRTRYEH